jgi:hypothetical protein
MAEAMIRRGVFRGTVRRPAKRIQDKRASTLAPDQVVRACDQSSASGDRGSIDRIVCATETGPRIQFSNSFSSPRQEGGPPTHFPPSHLPPSPIGLRRGRRAAAQRAGCGTAYRIARMRGLILPRPTLIHFAKAVYCGKYVRSGPTICWGNGTFFFVWTIIGLRVTALISVVLSVRGLWSRRRPSELTAVTGQVGARNHLSGDPSDRQL